MKEPSIDFDALIKDNDSKFEQSLVNLKAKRSKLVSLAAKALAEWFKKETSTTVERDFQTSSKLDDNRLRQMKKDVNALADKSMAIIEQHFAKSWACEDNLGSKKDFYYVPTNDHLDANFRQARCELGKVLAEYGFIGGDIERESFIRFSQTPLPGQVTSAVHDYVAELNQAKRLLDEERSLRREQSSFKSKERWDQL